MASSSKGPIGPKDKLFLVHLDEDDSEMSNRAEGHSEVVERLKSLHDQWSESVR